MDERDPATRPAWWLPDGTDGRRLRSAPRDTTRAIAARSRDTLRLLRPLPDDQLDETEELPAAPPPVWRQPRGGLVGRLDRFQRRHAVVGFPLAVIYKFADDQGPFLASSLAYYGFVSLFPLLLLLLTITGFVLHGDPGLQAKLLDSALRDVPIIGDQLKDNVRVTGSGLGLVVGVVGTLYGSLGLAQAGQTVFNRINSVPRNSRPNPLRSRWRSLRLLPVLGGLLILSSALSAVPVQTSIASYALGFGVHLTAIGLAVVVNIVLFTVAFRLLTADCTPVREVIIGATFAGIAWQGLQFGGAVFIADHFSHAGAVGGTFAIVLGGIVYIYVEALVVVFCAEINVVLRRRLWPRALLTPFTDDVDLTAADRRAYAGYARAERFKGFERIEIDFDGVPADPPTGAGPISPPPTDGPIPAPPTGEGPTADLRESARGAMPRRPS